jgi:trk system potassium uptake protein TrkA
MKIVIIGAGTLGERLADALLGGGNEVTIVDKDEAILQKLDARMDIMTVVANAKSVELLKELHVEVFDALIAVTDDDEKNIFIASFAKRLGCPMVIARAHDPEHVDQVELICSAFDINHLVSPDMACANEIFKYLTEKYGLEGGRIRADGIEILEFDAEKMPELCDKQLKETSSLLPNMLIGAISRQGSMIIPNGNTSIAKDDKIYLIGAQNDVEKIHKRVGSLKDNTEIERVMIAGGGKTGYFLAKKLAAIHKNVRIIETDRQRCEYLSEKLDGVLVINGDATDINLLIEENLERMDAFVATTGSDEENLLLSLMAKQHGVEDVVAKMEKGAYTKLTESLGVTMAISPVDMTIYSILSKLKGEGQTVFTKMIQGQAEFSEIKIEKSMPIAGQTLRDIDIPDGVLITAVVRDGKTIIPNGFTELQPDDKVVILSLLSSVPMLEALIKTTK